MSFTDKLLGGGGESKSKTYLDDEQRGYLGDIWGQSQDLYNSGRSPVADLTPEMQQYIQQAMGFGNTASGYASDAQGMAGGFGNTANAGGDYLSKVLQGGGFQAPMQNGVNMDTVNGLINNDVLQGQIDASTRDIYRNLNENQMTGIASSSVGTGNAGSTRRGVAEAIAQRGADDRAADVAAGMRGNAYNQAVGVAANQAGANQNAMMGTNQMNASMAGNTFNAGGNLYNSGMNNAYGFNMGGVNMAGQGGNAMQNYMQQVAMAPWQKLQLYQGGVGSPITLSESTQAGGSAGAGGLMEGIGSMYSAFSDARLKDDITPTGETLGGFPVYRWVWNKAASALGLSGSATGVIAQEVEAHRPEAVSADESGFLKVDYAALSAA